MTPSLVDIDAGLGREQQTDDSPIARTAPKTAKELHDWIRTHLGRSIPRYSVCDDHDAPFDFVGDVFLSEITDAVVLAARATGKTDDMAQLHLANGYFKPGFETTHFGAIAMQAQRCMTYYEGGLKRPIFWPEGVTTAGLVGGGKASRWANGGYLEILPATEAQTQGGHPHLTSLDELEQGKAQPRENAKSMAEEYTDPLTGEERVGQYIELSTRVTGLGLMQRAIDEAEERGTPVYTWCVLESMRPCDGVGRNNLCDVVRDLPMVLRLDRGGARRQHRPLRRPCPTRQLRRHPRGRTGEARARSPRGRLAELPSDHHRLQPRRR